MTMFTYEVGEDLEFKFKLIERFDGYYAEINNKGAFLLAFNTFIIGSLLISYKDLVEIIEWNKKSHFSILLGIILLMSLSSMFFTIRAIMPYLKSKKDGDNVYKSFMFFKNIAEYDQSAYVSMMSNFQGLDISRELSIQVHNLSTGLHFKHKLVRVALIINIVQLFVLLPIVYLILF